jgi:TolB-like protein/DNA-binding SARP family transcriptional activator
VGLLSVGPIAPHSPADRHIVARAISNRLKLFGGAVVDVAGEPVTGRAAQRHRIALLALLSTTRRPHRSRDQLVALLWPEADAERGRKLLSDSIYRINQALGGDAITGAGDDIRLNREQLGCDVADFEAAVDAREWRCAAELYSGPFLDGFFLPDAAEFDQWIETERVQYARLAAKAIEALAVEARDAGEVAEEVEQWQRLAALSPEDSRIALELMRVLERAGNRAGALRHARVHASILRETLGVGPDRAVQELADQIAQRTDASVIASIPAAVARPAAGPEVERAPEPVETVDAPNAVAAGLVVVETATGRSGRRPWMLLTAVAIVAALVAVVQLRPTVQSGTSTPAAAPALGGSIAVLPFHNVSESDTNAYFADGMSEELMYLLTRTPGLHVASRTSAFAYRDLNLDVREVARQLHVDWILEGSVRRVGYKVRIVAQLTDARNGYQVWSESFDRTSNDVISIQQEIAIAIANRLPTIVGAPAN